MTCPKCGGKTEVKNSRSDEESVRRRRHCTGCGLNFFTVEYDQDMLEKIKSNSEEIKSNEREHE